MKSEDLFIPSDDLEFVPLTCLLFVYSYILFQASKIISTGSEMLLGVYGPGIIGGLVIPILGAIPDSAIVVASGIGPDAQEQLNVGVGTLAGSTIMLLTIPWGIGIYLGRRDLDEETGEAASVRVGGKLKAKLTEFSWTKNVITTGDNVPIFSKIMMLSTLSYLIIQIPAFWHTSSKEDPQKVGREENPYALVGFIVTLIAFFAYCLYQLIDARHDEYLKHLERELQRNRWKESLKHKLASTHAFEEVFTTFDRDNNGYLDRTELSDALTTLGLNVDRKELKWVLDHMDTDRDGVVSREEFSSIIAKWINHHSDVSIARRNSIVSGNDNNNNDINSGDENKMLSKEENDQKQQKARMSPLNTTTDAELREPFLTGENHEVLKDSDDEEEEEEEEEEFIELTDFQLKTRAFGLLILGTAMVTFFSEPMVDAIGNFGKKIHVDAFYVSFVVTPLASNASEVISAMIFARKKTNAGMSLTLSSLYGAATMNNTMGLCIFMGLVKFQNLEWNFSAEVIAIICVTLLVGINGTRKTINIAQAVFVASLYPLSLVLVASLKKAGLK